MNIVRNKLPLLLLLMTVVSMGCKNKTETVTSDLTEGTLNDQMVILTPTQLKNADLKIGKIETKNIRNIIELNGSVNVPPQNLVWVSFPLGGYVKKLNVLTGSIVKKGDTVALLEDPVYVNYQQDYLTAKNTLELLEEDLERQKSLSEKEASSKKNYQQALNSYNNQKIALKSLQEKLQIININPAKLNYATITNTVPVIAPISGYITQININIGRYVNPSDALLELVDPDYIEAQMVVYEDDLQYFHPGIIGEVFSAGNETKGYRVKVTLVTKNVSGAQRNAILHCQFLDKTLQIFPGMFLSGHFEIGNYLSKVLPYNAIASYEGRYYIFSKIDSLQYQIHEVIVGTEDKGVIELKNFNTNLLRQQIVTDNAYMLLSKFKNNANYLD
ncbi:MAG: efflux RND transporter periplasmic adaptor subunit [Phycisphaerales bacterium]|nr:efflux RND transporter periplasmic adaptor subunit [Phycisphaerales bacterium]